MNIIKKVFIFILVFIILFSTLVYADDDTSLITVMTDELTIIDTFTLIAMISTGYYLDECYEYVVNRSATALAKIKQVSGEFYKYCYNNDIDIMNDYIGPNYDPATLINECIYHINSNGVNELYFFNERYNIFLDFLFFMGYDLAGEYGVMMVAPSGNTLPDDEYGGVFDVDFDYNIISQIPLNSATLNGYSEYNWEFTNTQWLGQTHPLIKSSVNNNTVGIGCRQVNLAYGMAGQVYFYFNGVFHNPSTTDSNLIINTQTGSTRTIGEWRTSYYSSWKKGRVFYKFITQGDSLYYSLIGYHPDTGVQQLNILYKLDDFLGFTANDVGGSSIEYIIENGTTLYNDLEYRTGALNYVFNSTNVNTNDDTINHINFYKSDIIDRIISLKDGAISIGDIVIYDGGESNLVLDDMTLPDLIKTRFPFCIPSDIVKMIKNFAPSAYNAEELLLLDLSFDVYFGNYIQTIPLIIDLRDYNFDIMAMIMRYVFVAGWFITLGFWTKKLMFI